MDLLEVFCVATKGLSSIYHLICHLVLLHLFSMSEVVIKHKSLELCIDVCEVLKEKFKKYWDFIPIFFILVCIYES